MLSFANRNTLYKVSEECWVFTGSFGARLSRNQTAILGVWDLTVDMIECELHTCFSFKFLLRLRKCLEATFLIQVSSGPSDILKDDFTDRRGSSGVKPVVCQCNCSILPSFNYLSVFHFTSLVAVTLVGCFKAQVSSLGATGIWWNDCVLSLYWVTLWLSVFSDSRFSCLLFIEFGKMCGNYFWQLYNTHLNLWFPTNL